MDVWTDVCLVCGKRYFSKEQMEFHVRADHSLSQEEKPCRCPFCPYQDSEASKLENHMMRLHAKELATPPKEKEIKQRTSESQSGVRQSLEAPSCNVSEAIAEPTVCPVCGTGNFASVDLLSRHVENHFSDGESTSRQLPFQDELLAIRLQQQENYNQIHESQNTAEDLYFEELKEQYGMGHQHQGVGFQKQALRNMNKRVGKTSSPFEYYRDKLHMLERLEEGIDDGMTTSPGVFECLKLHLINSLKPYEKAWLSSQTDFIGRGPGDSGWGCGYRNIQMILSNLNKNPDFVDVMRHKFKGNIPSIPRIQEMIETAWHEGYDAKGREQLESKLAQTRKWIGATEVFACFASLKLSCRVIDFTKPSGANNSHPLLLHWVKQYFEGSAISCRVAITHKPPLYLQHDGHSRTIVGIICNEPTFGSHKALKAVKLIIFDPGMTNFGVWNKENLKKNARTKNNRTLCIQKFVKPVSSLNRKQYQIVCVDGLASPERASQQKDIDSICEKIS